MFKRTVHSTAAVVPADNDVLDTKGFDCVLDNGKAIQVRMHHHVGNVAVDKELARPESHDLVGWDTAVRAADPEVLRILLLRQSIKEIGLFGANPF